MPEEKMQFYTMTGWVTQDYYSEEEMAAAVDLTVEELRQHLSPSDYGDPPGERWRYVYHAHPLATGAGFEFTRGAYLNNIQRYQRRVYLQGRGEWDEVSAIFIDAFDAPDTPEKRLVVDAVIIETEEQFLNLLAAYRTAFENRDTDYHYSIRLYYER